MIWTPNFWTPPRSLHPNRKGMLMLGGADCKGCCGGVNTACAAGVPTTLNVDWAFYTDDTCSTLHDSGTATITNPAAVTDTICNVGSDDAWSSDCIDIQPIGLFDDFEGMHIILCCDGTTWTLTYSLHGTDDCSDARQNGVSWFEGGSPALTINSEDPVDFDAGCTAAFDHWATGAVYE